MRTIQDYFWHILSSFSVSEVCWMMGTLRVKLFKLIQILLFELIKVLGFLSISRRSLKSCHFWNQKCPRIFPDKSNVWLILVRLPVQLRLWVLVNNTSPLACSELNSGLNNWCWRRHNSNPLPSLGSLQVSLTSKLSRNLRFVFLVKFPPSG